MFRQGQLAVHGLAVLLGRNEAGISNRGEIFFAPRCIEDLAPTSWFTISQTYSISKRELSTGKWAIWRNGALLRWRFQRIRSRLTRKSLPIRAFSQALLATHFGSFKFYCQHLLSSWDFMSTNFTCVRFCSRYMDINPTPPTLTQHSTLRPTLNSQLQLFRWTQNWVWLKCSVPKVSPYLEEGER